MLTFSEDIADTPAMQITGTGVNPIAATNMTRFNATTYTYRWTVGTGDGTQTFTLSQGTDLVGNVIEPTSTTITVDNTAPVTPTVNTQTSNDTTPEITGTIGTSTALSLSETFSVALDGTTYTPTVVTDGTWSFTVSNANTLTSGTYEVVATATDTAGNVSTDTTSNELTIDTTAPTADVRSWLRVNGISYRIGANYRIPAVKAGDAVIVHARFSEDIADTPAMQITGTGVNPIAATNMTRFNATTYTYRWTVGTGDGTQTFTLSQGTDLAGNVSTDTASTTITVDNTAPTLTSFTPANNATNVLLDSNIVLTFNEEITIGTGNITLAPQGGTAINIPVTSTQVTGEGTSTITLNPTDDLLSGTSYEITIPATVFRDVAGNAYAGTTTNITTVVVDNTAPTADVRSWLRVNGISYRIGANYRIPAVKAGDTVIVHAKFSEDIADTPAMQITGTGVNPIAATNMTRFNATTYTYRWIPGTGDGTQTFTLSQGTDLVGNVIEPTSTTITVDNTAPTLTSFTPANNATNVPLDSNIVLTFNEEITIGTGNITLTPQGGTAINIPVTSTQVTGEGTSTITLNPTDDLLSGTSYEITIPATVFRDVAGNAYAGTTTNITTVVVDNTAPTADVRSWLRVNGISYRIGANYRIPAVKAGDTVIVHAKFSEDIADTPAMQITGTGVNPIAATNMTKINATTYIHRWTVGTGDGTQTFTLSQGTDLAGNVIEPTSAAITVDNTAPATPTVNAQTSNNSIPVITGTTGTGNALLTGETLSVALNGETYTPTVATDGTWSFTVSNANALADGTYNILVTVTDTTGNVSTDTTSNELTIKDTTAPTADVRSWLRVNGISYRIGANYRIPAVKAGDTVIVHAKCSEDIADTPAMQITGTGVNPIAATNMTRFNATTYTYRWIPGTGDGTQTFTLSQGTDLAGNVIEPTSTTITVDNTAPATTPTVNTLTSNDSIPQITGTIGIGNSLLTGETLSVALNGETYTPIVATDGTWHFTANTLVDGTYDITATVTDAAGNASADTTTNELTIKDTTAPTADVRSWLRVNGMSYRIGANYRIPAVKAGDTVIVHAKFSEDIADTPAMQITGTGVNPIAATNMTRFNATTYTYRWIPGTGDGTQTFTLSQGTDLVGNVIEPTSTTITVDNTAPTATIGYLKTINDTSVVVTQVEEGDEIIVHAKFSEDMTDSPPMQITGIGVNPIAATNMTKFNATTYYYFWTVGTGDGTQIFTLSQGTDLSGNVITPTSTSIYVTLSPPTASLHYYHINDDALADQVQAGDEVRVTATFDKDMAQSPAVQISGTGANNIDINGMTRVSARTYTYDWTVGTGLGEQTFTLSDGINLAGNEVIGTPTSGGTITVAKETIRPTAELSYYLYDADANPPMSDDPETKLYPRNTYRIRAEFSEDMAQSPAVQPVRLSGVGAQIITVNMTRVSPNVYHYFWTVADSVDTQVFTLSQATDLAGNEIIAEPTSSSGRIQVENRQGVCASEASSTEGNVQAEDPTPYNLDGVNGPSGTWVYKPSFSDEFDGDALDTTKWTQNIRHILKEPSIPYDPSYYLSVGDGVLTSRAAYEKHIIYARASSFGWTRHIADLELNGIGISGFDGSQPPSTRATTLYHHTGQGSFLFGHYAEEYYSHNRFSQKVEVPNGTYNVSFWAWAGGGHVTSAEVTVTLDDNNEITKTIHNSTSFIEYRIDNVVVTNGELTIAMEVEVDPGSIVRFDDFSVTPVGGTTNYVKNPGFEGGNPRFFTINKASAMRSLGKIECGYVEARLKAANTNSFTTTAFWLSANGNYDGKSYWNEIDIAEIGLPFNQPHEVATYRHHVWPVPPGETEYAAGYAKTSGLLAVNGALSNIAENYHVYAVEWTGEHLKAFHDGEHIGVTYNMSEYTTGVYDSPMNIIASTAKYSNDSLINEVNSKWDYIRVWQRPPSSE